MVEIKRLILYTKSLEEILFALRKAWEDGDFLKHAELSGFFGAHLPKMLRVIIPLFDQVCDFVRNNGPEGVDGVFLSLLSSIILIDQQSTVKGLRLVEFLGNKRYQTKEDHNIYLFDLGDASEALIEVCDSGLIDSRDGLMEVGDEQLKDLRSTFTMFDLGDRTRNKLYGPNGLINLSRGDRRSGHGFFGMDGRSAGLGGGRFHLGDMEGFSSRIIEEGMIDRMNNSRSNAQMSGRQDCINAFRMGGGILGAMAGSTAGATTGWIGGGPFTPTGIGAAIILSGSMGVGGALTGVSGGEGIGEMYCGAETEEEGGWSDVGTDSSEDFTQDYSNYDSNETSTESETTQNADGTTTTVTTSVSTETSDDGSTTVVTVTKTTTTNDENGKETGSTTQTQKRTSNTTTNADGTSQTTTTVQETNSQKKGDDSKNQTPLPPGIESAHRKPTAYESMVVLMMKWYKWIFVGQPNPGNIGSVNLGSVTLADSKGDDEGNIDPSPITDSGGSTPPTIGRNDKPSGVIDPKRPGTDPDN